ncbi:retrovirus-related pol polyprotein from transposon TNT 1-94 [Tanacetum coccineum]
MGRSSSRSKIPRPSKHFFPPCIHCGCIDHLSNECLYYPICGLCGSYDHDTNGHNRIISLEREINLKNPQHTFKRCEACGSSTHTKTDHYDIEWFKRGKALQSKKTEALKSTRAESSNANRSKTPTKIAFLNGKLKEEVDFKQPSGFESSEFPNHVCKLDKALYGLKQAPRAWYETLSTFLNEDKFVRGPDLNGKAVNETQYRSMIRSLMYLTASRPDIQLSTCLCFDLKGYFDSDYVGCNMDKKSTSGACQFLGGKLMCWSTKKQQYVAMFSVEAEYVAIAGCCTNILWMKSQLTDYDIMYEKVSIFCDNTSAIAISNNPVLHSRTKHIDIRYHILKGDIELHFILT